MTTLNPLIYVCAISNFNLAELESCMLRRPSHVVLMVSDHDPYQKGAERFASVLRQALPNVEIFRPDVLRGASFNGQNFTSIQNWISDHLLPFLDTLPKHPRACNITGGSKLFTLALSSPELVWAWLDYKAEEHNLQKLTHSTGRLVLEKEEKLSSALPFHVAHLHSEQVKEVQANPISSLSTSSALAEQLWHALETQNKGLLSLFGCKKYGLESVWSYNKYAERDSQLQLTSQDFLGKEQFEPDEMRWLSAWKALPVHTLDYSANSISLPNRTTKDDFKRWLSGDWLEQLAKNWLLEGGVPEKAIVMNLKINPHKVKSSIGERETDLVVHHKGKTTIIEVKTDLPPNSKPRDILQQITSLGERLGKTRKALFIGPQLQQKIQNHEQDIANQCLADGVILCRNKQELINAAH